MQLVIDALKTSKSFEDAGFAKPQADALASAMADSVLASREDLVTKDFLKAEMATLRGELKAEISSSKNDMVRWLLGSQAVLVVVLVALSNFTRAFG